MLSGPDTDFIVATNRNGMDSELKINVPRRYQSVFCPQDKNEVSSWDSECIRRQFRNFETAVFICKVST
jgi:hypothetical protein